MQILYYLLLLASILFATGNNICYHQLANEGKYSRFLFTALSSVVWIIVLAPLSNLSNILPIEIIFGIIYGVVQALFLFFKMRAMSTGPISITSVVCNCSMLITTLFGIFVYDEKSSVLQIIGLVAILASVILCADPKSDMKMTFKWAIYCLFYFLFCAAVGIVFKVFGKTEGNGSNMIIVSAVTMVVLLLILSLATKEKFSLSKKQAFYAVLAGILSCCYNRFNLILTANLPSVVFFPIFNGTLVLFCTVVGAVIYKEKFSKMQLAGVIIGIVAIVLLSGAIETMIKQ
ncbi:MAG: EamA family transporter [Clostridia bacterium]|nr:EamA family transporter [Clostridia bacterium]